MSVTLPPGSVVQGLAAELASELDRRAQQPVTADHFGEVLGKLLTGIDETAGAVPAAAAASPLAVAAVALFPTASQGPSKPE